MTNRFREEEAIRRAQLGSGRRSFVHGELLSQGKVLDRELAVAAEEEGEESKQVEQESDHRAGIVSGSGPTDQPLARPAIVLAKDRVFSNRLPRTGIE